MNQFVKLQCEFEEWEYIGWGRHQSFYKFRTILINLENILYIKIPENEDELYKIYLQDRVLYAEDIDPILVISKHL